MISCDTFRSRFAPATEDAALLEHVRACDACLESAAEIDPDIMFRAIGGAEMMPPGGVDAFVEDVMREVRIRNTESAMVRPAELPWSRRLAVAATIAAVVTGGTFFYQRSRIAPAVPAMIATAPMAEPALITNKPVVEQYDSDRATIVEMPADGAADVAVVMVFDENLPADL